MKVLVLGGTRYVGRHLVRELLSAGHDVTIATRGKAPDDFQRQVRRKIVERQDPDSLSAAFGSEFYDVVVDNLAYSSDDVRFLLDAVHINKYVMTSTASVYRDFHMNLQEAEFDAKNAPLKWCGRDQDAYDESKRQAESALLQAYPDLASVVVRFPWIFGADDYTNRLLFYVEHILNARPMNMDNGDARLAFIHSLEAGRFLAWCAESPVQGVMNASSCGTISLGEILDYAQRRMGKKAILDVCGEPAPLNGVPSFSLDTAAARQSGFTFQPISQWLYPLIDCWDEALGTA